MTRSLWAGWEGGPVAPPSICWATQGSSPVAELMVGQKGVPVLH